MCDEDDYLPVIGTGSRTWPMFLHDVSDRRMEVAAYPAADLMELAMSRFNGLCTAALAALEDADEAPPTGSSTRKRSAHAMSQQPDDWQSSATKLHGMRVIRTIDEVRTDVANTIMMAAGSDLLNTLALPLTLPSAAQPDLTHGFTMPWNTISFINILDKSEQVGSPKHVTQALEYCAHVLSMTPLRQRAFAAITNGKACLFVGVVRLNDTSFHWFKSGVIPQEHMTKELAAFLATPQASLGFEHAFPAHLFRPLTTLGRGSAACVMRCKHIPDDRDVVLKISANLNAMKMERLLLEHLHKSDGEGLLHAHVPEIIGDIQIALSADSYCQHMTAFTSRALVSILPDQQDEACVLSIWQILKHAHAAGVGHCDVRWPNCKRSPDGQVVLIDWCAGRPLTGRSTMDDFDPSMLQHATRITASPSVLQGIAADSKRFDYYPADDGYALICMTLQACFGCKYFQGGDLPADTLFVRDLLWRELMSKSRCQIRKSHSYTISKLH